MTEPNDRDRVLAGLLGVEQNVDLRTIAVYREECSKAERERVLAELLQVADEMVERTRKPYQRGGTVITVTHYRTVHGIPTVVAGLDIRNARVVYLSDGGASRRLASTEGPVHTVGWLMTAGEARELAGLLLDRADDLEMGGTT